MKLLKVGEIEVTKVFRRDVYVVKNGDSTVLFTLSDAETLRD